MAHPEFPQEHQSQRRGRKPIILAIFPRKLDEIEINWIEMGAQVPRAPLDPALTSYFFHFELITLKGQ